MAATANGSSALVHDIKEIPALIDCIADGQSLFVSNRGCFVQVALVSVAVMMACVLVLAGRLVDHCRLGVGECKPCHRPPAGERSAFSRGVAKA
jgi:hypothetical protein